MKNKVVIAGSASLQEKVRYWKSFWENDEYEVVNYPSSIPSDTFLDKYPQIHKKFFDDIENANVVFIMNETKNGIIGYIGAESFAEMAFAVAQNLVHGKNIEIILLQMPEERVQSHDEVLLWLKLGWIKLYK